MTMPTPSGHTILVPLDRSELAERALGPATTIAERTGARLVLLTVPEVCGMQPVWYTAAPGMPEMGGIIPMQDLVDESRAGAEDYLRERVAELADRGLAADALLDVGFPADSIVRTAEERGVDLVVMATHGYGGLSRWAFGSVADKVLQGLTRPVLLVRAGADGTPTLAGDMLVALDGSPLAEQILPAVERLAPALGSAVTAAYVVPEPPPTPRTDALLAAEREHVEAMRGYLDGVVARLAAAGIQAGAEILEANEDEDAAHVLLARAARGPVGLVAMTTHGRGGLSRWAYGSVADRVLRHAEVPVLLQRSRGGD
jgi:nucleotide-binding universal stress UspA family protein